MHSTHAVRTTRLGGTLLALALGLLAGCTTGRSASQAPDYVALYKSGQYAKAYDAAAALAGSQRTVNRDQPALYAGMSAQALNRNTDAVRWLSPLDDSTNREIAGNANATLGLIAQERSDHASAIEHLSKAARQLSGDASARAMMYQGDSLKATDRTAEAQQVWTAARDRVVSDASLRVMIGDRLAGYGPSPNVHTGAAVTAAKSAGKAAYTVQAGAFGTPKKAQSTAGRLGGYGASRVVPIRTHDGKTLYAVRVGRYNSMQDADLVRRRIGGGAVVTSTADE